MRAMTFESRLTPCGQTMWSDHSSRSSHPRDGRSFTGNPVGMLPAATAMRQSWGMTDYTDPSTSSLRLSNADRDAAVSALSRAHADGRISADEFSERSATAKTAVTRGDLAPLFSDLPAAVHGTESAPPASFSGPPAGTPSYAPQAPRDTYTRARPLGGAAGVAAVSITPIVVLVVFLAIGFLVPGGFAWSWVFWLAVPIVAIIVYGPGGRNGYNSRD